MTTDETGREANISVSEVIRLRRSIRRFTPLPIEDEVIASLIAAALWSPSPHNAQPWRFVNIRPDSKSRLAVAMAQAMASDLHKRGVASLEIDRMTHRSITRIKSAPSAVLCCTVADGLKLTGDVGADRLERQMAIQSVGAVLQSLFLVASEHAIGTCWMAAPMYCPDVVVCELNLPEMWLPQALVLLGFPDREASVQPRRPVRDILTTR